MHTTLQVVLALQDVLVQTLVCFVNDLETERSPKPHAGATGG